jgi:Phage tail assembly chaperone proteins, E, or 41 or 14
MTNNGSSATTIKLARPVQINGKDVSEVKLDLDSLKGKDLLELETGFRRAYRGEYIPVLNIDSRFQAWVAGRACGINPEDLGELYAPDFAAVVAEVQSFLLSSA